MRGRPRSSSSGSIERNRTAAQQSVAKVGLHSSAKPLLGGKSLLTVALLEFHRAAIGAFGSTWARIVRPREATDDALVLFDVVDPLVGRDSKRHAGLVVNVRD